METPAASNRRIPIALRQEMDRRLKANYEADKARPISARLAMLISKIDSMFVDPEEDELE
jgi:hypothetical protein